ncbi:MAG TPA: hypothetical protein PLH03_03585, partial [Methylophilaceae bacterium]|nr:hypothetical protein [Methylophilaceae bacterium]
TELTASASVETASTPIHFILRAFMIQPPVFSKKIGLSNLAGRMCQIHFPFLDLNQVSQE